MSTAVLTTETIFECESDVTSLDAESTGLVLSREEFLAIDEVDDHYRYELTHGVVVVSPPPGPAETESSDVLSHLLRNYDESNSERSTLDKTVPEFSIDTGACIRRADRVIWAGLGRKPVPGQDVPTIVVEFVPKSSRDRRRDYVEKRAEYAAIGVVEYWVVDPFRRTLTVCCGDQVKRVVKERETYETPLLPGFELPLSRLLEVADDWPDAKR